MQESVLQRKIQKYLKEKLIGSVIWKNHGNQYSVAGLPDIMCLYKKKLIAIEVKINGNKPTRLQEVMLQNLKDAGAYTCVAYCVLDVEKMLIKNNIMQGGPINE